MTAYRVHGTTDDVTTCQICGKPELRGTVILEILDADGNAEEITYAGTTCAAKLAGGRTTGLKIRQRARAADVRRAEYVRFARQMLDFFAPYEGQPPAVLGSAYRDANSGYFRNNPGADATALALESLARHRETVATDGLSVLRRAA